MRVTQQMLHHNSVRHMSQNLSRFEKTNSQVASGKLLERPSDDPHGISKAMSLKSSIAENGQYEKNIDEAKLWLDETDQTISKMTDIVQRVRELAVHGNNGTLADEDRKTIQAEILQLREQITEFEKAKVNGQNLFGSEKKITISNGINISANVDLSDLRGNTLNVLTAAADAIGEGNEASIGDIDESLNNMLRVQAEVGARMNRVEAFENRVLDNTLQLGKMLSNIEDVDYAEAMIRLKSEESIYQASLSATSRIIQPSLMDFLR